MPSWAQIRRDLRLFAKYHLVQRPAVGPVPEQELDVQPLGYDPERYAETLAGSSGEWSHETLEEVAFERRRHPMFVVRTPSARGKRLLVLAGVHGNEEAGLLAVPRLLERRGAGAWAPVSLAIVTPVNPVGAAHRSRYNGDGFDINRDFDRFWTLEARAVRRVVDDFEPDFILSLHEGPQEAAFFFANRCVDPSVAERVLADAEQARVLLAEVDYLHRRLPRAGYAPTSPVAAMAGTLWNAVFGMMTTGMYAERLGLPEITLETSWRSRDGEARIEAHVAVVTALARALGAPV